MEKLIRISVGRLYTIVTATVVVLLIAAAVAVVVGLRRDLEVSAARQQADMTLQAIAKSVQVDLLSSNLMAATDRIQSLIGAEQAKFLGVEVIESKTGQRAMAYDPFGVVGNKSAEKISTSIFFNPTTQSKAFDIQVSFVPSSFQVSSFFRILMMPVLLALLALVALASMAWLTRMLFKRSSDLILSSAAKPVVLGRLQIKELEVLRETVAELDRTKTANALIEVAATIAHDTRGPLNSLDKIIETIPNLPEAQVRRLKEAMRRIQGMSDNLLERYRRQLSATAEGATASEDLSGQPVEHVLVLVESILSEKRNQYMDHEKIVIEFDERKRAYGAFAKLNANDFGRVLSNLVDNAVEALDGEGKVFVGLESVRDRLKVTVSDSGKGIPPEIMPKLMQRGATFGKAKGSGLGLYYVKTTIESIGGTVAIQSRPGRTLVTLEIPSSSPPAWFVPAIEIPSGTTVVMLDDDQLVHGAVKLRIGDRAPLRHFYKGSEFNAWVRSLSRAELENYLFLCDYELHGESETGLDHVERLGIASRSLLLTGRSSDPTIQRECLRLGIGLVPKALVAQIPIAIAS